MSVRAGVPVSQPPVLADCSLSSLAAEGGLEKSSAVQMQVPPHNQMTALGCWCSPGILVRTASQCHSSASAVCYKTTHRESRVWGDGGFSAGSGEDLDQHCYTDVKTLVSSGFRHLEATEVGGRTGVLSSHKDGADTGAAVGSA